MNSSYYEDLDQIVKKSCRKPNRLSSSSEDCVFDESSNKKSLSSPTSSNYSKHLSNKTPTRPPPRRIHSSSSSQSSPSSPTPQRQLSLDKIRSMQQNESSGANKTVTGEQLGKQRSLIVMDIPPETMKSRKLYSTLKSPTAKENPTTSKLLPHTSSSTADNYINVPG